MKWKLSLVVFIMLICSSAAIAAEAISSSTLNWLTRSSGDRRYCTIDGANCPLGNATINVTISNGTTPHTLNGSNHTGTLSSVRVIKDTGTNFLGELLDSIIDQLFGKIEAVNTTSNIQDLGFTTGAHTVDTNASTACSGSEVLFGNGTCGEISIPSGGINASQVKDQLGFFVNLTLVKYNSSWSFGGLTGYKAGNAICNNEFPGTHACWAHEIGNHFSYNKSFANFTDTFWINELAPGFLADAADCQARTTDLQAALGAIQVGNTIDGGTGSLVTCSAFRSIGCCK